MRRRTGDDFFNPEQMKILTPPGSRMPGGVKKEKKMEWRYFLE
jgi:hypothetical protein